MASSQTCSFSLFLFYVIPLTLSQPTALVLPVTKHASTLQYVTQISQRTPLVPINVVVELGGPALWVSCESSTYKSSSYKSAQCHSVQCSLAHGNASHCSNNNSTCIFSTQNAFTSTASACGLSEDVLGLQSTDGLNPNSVVSVPHFLFLCAPYSLLQGLASGASGVAGFGAGPIGLPLQLITAFNITPKFAFCLPPSSSTDSSNGVIFLGDGPYAFSPGIDVSKLLIYTPLIMKSSDMHEYYIRVNSVRVNNIKVPVNQSLLLTNKGNGGTKISTVNPYTVMETSIYTSLIHIFIHQAMAANVTRVGAVAPFDICFNTRNLNEAFPIIDLILQEERVFWRIFQTNSMVAVGGDVACLGFLDGGLNPRASIIIGGHQLEDNLLQFDLISSRLGFTSSLLLRQTSCSYFNFTSSV